MVLPSAVKSRVSAALLVAAFAAGCDGCNRTPSPPPPTRHDAAPAPVAARDGGGVRRDDACEILEPAQRDLVVARINDQTLTLCDFTRRINSNNPYLRARFAQPEQRRALLQSWIDAELLAAEAHERHLDDEPEVRRAVTMQLARRLEMLVRGEVAQPEVTDAEVQAYYDAHRAEYVTEAQVRASQIVLATREEADRVLAEVRAHEDDDALFRERVRRLSVDTASRAADGDLDFFPEAGSRTVQPEVANAAFTLQRNGQILDRVIESAHGGANGQRGFHVVRLIARREALHRTLEEESRRIRARLLRDKRDGAEEAAMRALIERLRGAATVQIDEAALARVEVTPAPGTPPAMPPGMVPPGAMPGVPRGR